MKANSKRKVFGDAVDLLMGDMEEVIMPIMTIFWFIQKENKTSLLWKSM